MTNTTKASLALAVAEALLTIATASAQIPAPGQNGRALDANNRVGSGGMNQSVNQGGVSPNQIIYGDVTGGKRFRGPIGEVDPGAFYGPTAGRFSDRFVAGSSAAPQPYQPQMDASVAQPFYGASRAAPPPPGSFREGFSGAYLGTSLTPATEFEMNYLGSTSDWQTQRLGETSVLGTHSTLIGSPSGETYLQGTGPENQTTSLSASALYGIQPLRSDLDIANEATTAQTAGLLAGPGDRLRFDSAEMRRMRNELQNPAEQEQPNNAQPGASQQPSALGQSLNPPDNGAQGNSGQANGAQTGSGLSNDLQTGQATQKRFTIVAPELQSTQYREMRRIQSQYENPQYVQMEAQHRARLERNVLATKAGGGGASTQPAQGLGAGAMIKHPNMGEMNTQPLKVTSLATGVRAKGLHDMLASAEDFMRQGKFQTAIDRYNVALQIAPNNPLISLGRANAELGAGAYRLASADLHNVFANDRATLVAQYDLKGWFPSDRLQAVERELNDLSSKDTKDEMPEFLLAYIGYNLGDSAEAARHIENARKRAGANDRVLDLLEREWKLEKPATSPKPAAPDLNK